MAQPKRNALNGPALIRVEDLDFANSGPWSGSSAGTLPDALAGPTLILRSSAFAPLFASLGQINQWQPTAALIPALRNNPLVDCAGPCSSPEREMVLVIYISDSVKYSDALADIAAGLAYKLNLLLDEQCPKDCMCSASVTCHVDESATYTVDMETGMKLVAPGGEYSDAPTGVWGGNPPDEEQTDENGTVYVITVICDAASGTCKSGSRAKRK